MDFVQNLTGKLPYGKDPKLISLDALAETADITTANTVTTIATYSSPKITGFDTIEFAYNFTIDNGSANSEDFDVTIDFGGASLTGQVTVSNATTDNITVKSNVVNIGNDKFLVTCLITDDNANVFHSGTVITQAALTDFTLTIENTSVIAAGCTYIGHGGYVLLDNVTNA